MASVRSRQTPQGTRYDVRFRVNGIQRTKTFRTHEDAKAFRRKVEGEELAGFVTDPKGGERLFGEYADAWVDHRLVKGRPPTPATAQGYRALLRRYLHPTFGATRLRQITPERIRLWHAQTAESSRDQAAKGYRLLRAILNTVVADGLIGRNPCTIRGAGIEQARERPMLDTATVLKLADAIEPRLRCLVLLGGFAGMRSGELLGLQRHDIDPLHRTVTVERQAHELTGLGRVLMPPKSEAGRRTAPSPPCFCTPSRTICGTSWRRRSMRSSSPGRPASHFDARICRTRGRLRALWSASMVYAPTICATAPPR